MLHVQELGVHVSVNPTDVRSAMRAMADFGWTPAVLTTEDYFLSLAGLAPETLGPNVRLDQRRYRPREEEATAEVFFSQDDIFFCLYARSDMGQIHAEMSDPRRIAAAPDLPPLLVGIVTPEHEEAASRLVKFADCVRQSLGKVMDGRRFRHLDFSWEAPSSAQSPVASLVQKLDQEGADPSFKEPDTTEEQVAASKVLAGEFARQLLIELSTAGGFAREQDILAKRGDKEESVKAMLEQLTGVNLLRSEYLLQCRATSTPLTRIPDESALQEPSVAQLRCANCSRAYSEELCLLGLQVSPLGKTLLNGSHWMTVWVTDSLVDIGIPSHNIRWSLTETSEEIDIIAEVAGQLWIIELKDRDFGPGDAYPFSYRRARYGPDEAIIVTTGRVTEDAKRVFEELSREWHGRGSEPLVIEGLENAEAAFKGAFQRATLWRAIEVVRPVARMTGFQLQRVVTAHYGDDTDV